MLSNNKRKLSKSIVCHKIVEINRLLGLLFVCVLIGITCLSLPANAAPNRDNSYLVSLVPPSSNPPIFDPQKVNLGITPTGWSNSDDQTIDLTPPIPYQQIMSEMALSGFKGTQGSPKFPKDMEVLKSELKLRNLKISEPWVGMHFTEPGKKEETIEEFKKQINFMKEMGGNRIVVAEMGGAVHLNKDVDPLTDRPRFNDQQWRDLTDGLNTLGLMAKNEGFQLCYHPHIGTGVENLADIDRLMANTNSDNVKLLLDTGHLYYAGVNPLDVTQKYANRIKHVHLKNIRQSVLDDSKQAKRSFLNAIRAGIFTVPGDPAGAIDFKPILDTLAKANYQGWLIVEAEQDPNKANPLKYALMARTYLAQVTGL
jgi:inosose dehydratase